MFLALDSTRVQKVVVPADVSMTGTRHASGGGVHIHIWCSVAHSPPPSTQPSPLYVGMYVCCISFSESRIDPAGEEEDNSEGEPDSEVHLFVESLQRWVFKVS